MKLEKIDIYNFKSIEDESIEIKKYGGSYAAMLLGVNESGKSNVLQALSYLDTPSEEVDIYDIRNLKSDENEHVEIAYHLVYENPKSCRKHLLRYLKNESLIDFDFKEVIKTIFLEPNDTSFSVQYTHRVRNLTQGLYFKEVQESKKGANGQPETIRMMEVLQESDDKDCKPLTEESFELFFSEQLDAFALLVQPKVTYWAPSDEYLIREEELSSFAQDVNSNPILRNMFNLAGYSSPMEIESVISRVEVGRHRSSLMSKLQSAINDYIKSIWKHEVDIIIDITESGRLTLSVRDTGEENEHDRLALTGRSAGARHFISLIMSLSLGNKNEKIRNRLILVDEPENHLHPSGVRDLRTELLKIGKNNYLFAATHSPFLVDKNNKQRNIIVTKDRSAKTHFRRVQNDTDIADEEVLQEAFGIDVYRDLINPYSILLEGGSDKEIIRKGLTAKGNSNVSLSNGTGSNIDVVAAKLLNAESTALVIVDDDKDGKNYKKKILRLGAPYTPENVFTIRDLVPEIVDGGTIEDTLGQAFIKARYAELMQEEHGLAVEDFDLSENAPVLPQLVSHVKKLKGANHKEILDALKLKVSNELEIGPEKFKRKFPLLEKLLVVGLEKLEA